MADTPTPDAHGSSSLKGSNAWGATLRTARELVITLGMAAAVFFLVQATVRNYRVEGLSMQHSLENGELVLVSKLSYLQIGTKQPFGGPNRGDVIVFHAVDNSGKFLVKRVIGLPGDTVEMRQGVVYSNGKPVDEHKYITLTDKFTMAPLVVPPGKYFALGDNRPGSSDSRYWGLLPRNNIVGRAVLSYWPTGHIGVIAAPRF